MGDYRRYNHYPGNNNRDDRPRNNSYYGRQNQYPVNNNNNNNARGRGHYSGSYFHDRGRGRGRGHDNYDDRFHGPKYRENRDYSDIFRPENWQPRRDEEEYRRRPQIDEEFDRRTDANMETLKYLERLRGSKPYLLKRKKEIADSRKERLLADELEDIEYCLDVISDENADKNFGLHAIKTAHDKVLELVRNNPVTSVPPTVEIEDDEEELSGPRSPSPGANSCTIDDDILVIPTERSHVKTDWNYRPNLSDVDSHTEVNPQFNRSLTNEPHSSIAPTSRFNSDQALDQRRTNPPSNYGQSSNYRDSTNPWTEAGMLASRDQDMRKLEPHANSPVQVQDTNASVGPSNAVPNVPTVFNVNFLNNGITPNALVANLMNTALMNHMMNGFQLTPPPPQQQLVGRNFQGQTPTTGGLFPLPPPAFTQTPNQQFNSLHSTNTQNNSQINTVQNQNTPNQDNYSQPPRKALLPTPRTEPIRNPFEMANTPRYNQRPMFRPRGGPHIRPYRHNFASNQPEMPRLQTSAMMNRFRTPPPLSPLTSQSIQNSPRFSSSPSPDLSSKPADQPELQSNRFKDRPPPPVVYDPRLRARLEKERLSSSQRDKVDSEERTPDNKEEKELSTQTKATLLKFKALSEMATSSPIKLGDKEKSQTEAHQRTLQLKKALAIKKNSETSINENYDAEVKKCDGKKRPESADKNLRRVSQSEGEIAEKPAPTGSLKGDEPRGSVKGYRIPKIKKPEPEPEKEPELPEPELIILDDPEPVDSCEEVNSSPTSPVDETPDDIVPEETPESPSDAVSSTVSKHGLEADDLLKDYLMQSLPADKLSKINSDSMAKLLSSLKGELNAKLQQLSKEEEEGTEESSEVGTCQPEEETQVGSDIDQETVPSPEVNTRGRKSRALTRKGKEERRTRRSSLDKLHDALQSINFDSIMPLRPRRSAREPDPPAPAEEPSGPVTRKGRPPKNTFIELGAEAVEAALKQVQVPVQMPDSTVDEVQKPVKGKRGRKRKLVKAAVGRKAKASKKSEEDTQMDSPEEPNLTRKQAKKVGRKRKAAGKKPVKKTVEVRVTRSRNSASTSMSTGDNEDNEDSEDNEDDKDNEENASEDEDVGEAVDLDNIFDQSPRMSTIDEFSRFMTQTEDEPPFEYDDAASDIIMDENIFDVDLGDMDEDISETYFRELSRPQEQLPSSVLNDALQQVCNLIMSRPDPTVNDEEDENVKEVEEGEEEEEEEVQVGQETKRAEIIDLKIWLPVYSSEDNGYEKISKLQAYIWNATTKKTDDDVTCFRVGEIPYVELIPRKELGLENIINPPEFKVEVGFINDIEYYEHHYYDDTGKLQWGQPGWKMRQVISMNQRDKLEKEEKEEKEKEKKDEKEQEEQEYQEVKISTKIARPNLEGSDLYRCANTFCSFMVADSTSFREHANACKTDEFGPVCYHCRTCYNTVANLMEHLKKHARMSQICTLCAFRCCLNIELSKHMKLTHKVNSFKIIKIIESTEKGPKPEYLVYPKDVWAKLSSAESIKENKIKYCSQVKYTPEQIDAIPLSAIFPSVVFCGVCPYSTKVRSNIIRHLKLHERAALDGGVTQVPTEAPLNPVPELERNERMFDKTANWAGSSHAKGKSGNAGEDAAKVPPFVEEQFRYVCSVPSCKQLTGDEGLLRSHMKALHSDVDIYECPHCQTNEHTRNDPRNSVSIDKIAAHLKFHGPRLLKCPYCDHIHVQIRIMEKHVAEKHQEKKLFYLEVRNLDGEGNSSRRRSVDDLQKKSSDQWRCLLCRALSDTWDEAKAHCESTHGMNDQFMCSSCRFGCSSISTIELHITDETCIVTGKESSIMIMFYRNDSSGGPDSKENPNQAIWRRDSTKLKHIRGIYLEEIKQPAEPKEPKLPKVKLPKVPKVKKLPEGKIETPENSNILETTESAKRSPKKKFQSPSREQAEKPSNPLLVCPSCNMYKTTKPDDFVIHLYNEYQYKRYGCAICSIGFVTVNSLKIHITNDHDNEYDEATHLKLAPQNPDLEKKAQNVLKLQLKKSEPKSVSKHPGILEVLVQCKHCDAELSSYHNYKTHLIAKHLSPKRFRCKHCDTGSWSEGFLKLHYTKAHPEQEFDFELNDQFEETLTHDFWLKEYGIPHTKWTRGGLGRTSANSFPTKPAGSSSSVPGGKRKAKTEVGQAGQKSKKTENSSRLSSGQKKRICYRCGHCDRLTVALETIRNHWEKMHKKDSLQCMYYRRETKPAPQVWYCDFCSFVSRNTSVLHAHFGEHHGTNSVTCRTTVNSEDQTSLACSYCNHKTSGKVEMEDHNETDHPDLQLKYTDRTPYVEVVEKFFIETTHYECHHCKQRFSDEETCLNHMMTYHGEPMSTVKATLVLYSNECDPETYKTKRYEPVECPKCDHVSDNMEEAKEHIKTTHIFPFKCPKCIDSYFRSRSDASFHFRHHHGDEKLKPASNTNAMIEFEDIFRRIKGIKQKQRSKSIETAVAKPDAEQNSDDDIIILENSSSTTNNQHQPARKRRTSYITMPLILNHFHIKEQKTNEAICSTSSLNHTSPIQNPIPREEKRQHDPHVGFKPTVSVEDLDELLALSEKPNPSKEIRIGDLDVDMDNDDYEHYEELEFADDEDPFRLLIAPEEDLFVNPPHTTDMDFIQLE